MAACIDTVRGVCWWEASEGVGRCRAGWPVFPLSLLVARGYQVGTAVLRCCGVAALRRRRRLCARGRLRQLYTASGRMLVLVRRDDDGLATGHMCSEREGVVVRWYGMSKRGGEGHGPSAFPHRAPSRLHGPVARLRLTFTISFTTHVHRVSRAFATASCTVRCTAPSHSPSAVPPSIGPRCSMVPPRARQRSAGIG